jgi:hypothetical protein
LRIDQMREEHTTNAWLDEKKDLTMNKTMTLIGAFTAGIASLLMVPVQAHANREIFPATGSSWITIGNINLFGGTTLAVETKDLGTGKCHWDYLGSPGATDFTIVHGSSAGDLIMVAPPDYTSTCGIAFSPPNMRGFGLFIQGGNGDDWISGGSVLNSNIELRGESGADLLISSPGGKACGGTDRVPTNSDAGNTLWGQDIQSEQLFGANGNDHLCEHRNTLVAQLSGAGGSDTRCGSSGHLAVPASLESIENVDCGACGSGY